MKVIICIVLVLGFSSTSFAQSFDDSRCSAAKGIIGKMAENYISRNLFCTKDTDCSEVYYTGYSFCGSLMVNQYGAAGQKLLLESPEYKRLSKVVDNELAKYACGPQPACSQRPPGDVKCASNKCVFEFR